MSARYFREHVDGAAIAAGTADLSWIPPERGRVWHVTRAVAVNETSATTTSTRLIVRGHGYDHLLNGRVTAVALLPLVDTGEAMLVDGDELHALFVGATNADVVHLYLEGWSELIEEFTGE